MSRSLIQTVNAGPQDVAEMGVIGLGATTRRYGCNLRQSGDAIEASGCGYYDITAAVTVAADAAGAVSVSVYKDGAPVTGATGSATVAAADNLVTIPIVSTIRLGCDETATITFVITDGSGTVENISVRAKKA